MTYATATFSDVTPFDGRILSVADWRRLFRGFAAGLGSLAGAVLAVGGVVIAALWMASVVLSTNPHLHVQGPSGPATLALANHFPTRAGAPDFFGAASIWTKAAYAPHPQQAVREAELTPPAAPILATSRRAPMPAPHHASVLERAPPLTHARARPPQTSDHLVDVPLPRPHPLWPAVARAMTQNPIEKIARTPAVKPAEKPAEKIAKRTPIAAPPPADLERPAPPPVADTETATPPAPGSRTAVYDIAAHTVFMPDGRRLEAHSGLGRRRDDPRYVNVKDRGPTPPNVYHLTLRSQLFHGVRAIRLTPIGDGKMYGRDGMLAHTYMLGPSGQSFGCVSFKHYQKFLQAFLNGEVDRMVVVPHLGARIAQVASHRDGKRYAFNDR